MYRNDFDPACCQFSPRPIKSIADLHPRSNPNPSPIIPHGRAAGPITGRSLVDHRRRHIDGGGCIVRTRRHGTAQEGADGQTSEHAGRNLAVFCIRPVRGLSVDSGSSIYSGYAGLMG